MTLPSRKVLLANAVCLLGLLWIYGGDARDALQAQSAEASAFLSLPDLLRPSIVLGLTVLAVGGVVWGLLRRQGDDFKGYRLLPILLVGALFVDMVFAERRTGLPSSQLADMSLQYFQGLVQQQATTDAVPADPAQLRSLLEKLPGHPPYLVRGQPSEAYTLQVRQDCEGPVRSASGLQLGTLIYCVAPGRKAAWITLVGLPAERRFGTPEVLSVEGEARFYLVQPLPPEEGDAAGTPAASPFRGATGQEPPPSEPSAEGQDARPAP